MLMVTCSSHSWSLLPLTDRRRQLVRRRRSPPATKSLMLESVRSTQAAPGYCSRKKPRGRGQVALLTETRCLTAAWTLDRCDVRHRFLPVCEVVFVHVQESCGDVTGHPLEDQGLWGHGLCSPAAPEVTLHIALHTHIKPLSVTASSQQRAVLSL